MKMFLSFLIFVLPTLAQDVSSSLKEFNRIELNVHADVYVKIGDKHHIEIEGDDREVERIDVDVYNDKLIVEHDDLRKGLFGWFKDFRRDMDKVKIIITTKSLEELEFSGVGSLEIRGLNEAEFELAIKGPIDTEVEGNARELFVKNYGPGDINFDEIDAEVLEIDNYGPGDIAFAGKAKYVKAALFGPGEVDAYDLDAEELRAKVIGPGGIKMTVLEEVSATIMGPGDVRVKGNPRIASETSFGPGEIVRY